MGIILFIPFNSHEENGNLKKAALGWFIASFADTHHPNRSKPIIVEYGKTNPDLKTSSVNDQIYVLCHGGNTYGRVYNDINGIYSISMDEAANRLHTSGLKVYHKIIKLWMCNAVPNLAQVNAVLLYMALRKNHPIVDILFYRASLTGVAANVSLTPTRRMGFVQLGPPVVTPEGIITNGVFQRAGNFRASVKTEISQGLLTTDNRIILRTY